MFVLFADVTAEPQDSGEIIDRVWTDESHAPEIIDRVWTDESHAPEPDILLSTRADALTTSPTDTRHNANDAHNHTASTEDVTSPSTDPTGGSEQQNDLTVRREHDQFLIIRTLVVLLTGILVRLAFCWPAGEQFVQVRWLS